jgi:hypothetical protein
MLPMHRITHWFEVTDQVVHAYKERHVQLTIILKWERFELEVEKVKPTIRKNSFDSVCNGSVLILKQSL